MWKKNTKNIWYFTSCRSDEYTLYDPDFNGMRDEFSVYFTNEFVESLKSSTNWHDAFQKTQKRFKRLSVQLKSRIGSLTYGFKGMHPTSIKPKLHQNIKL